LADAVLRDIRCGVALSKDRGVLARCFRRRNGISYFDACLAYVFLQNSIVRDNVESIPQFLEVCSVVKGTCWSQMNNLNIQFIPFDSN
jgi:hypothetical protein